MANQFPKVPCQNNSLLTNNISWDILSKENAYFNPHNQLKGRILEPQIINNKLEVFYQKLEETKKWEQIGVLNTKTLDYWLDYWLDQLQIQITAENDNQLNKKLNFLRTSPPETKYVLKLLIETLTEFKNLEPVLPEITEMTKLLKIQTKALENILSKGRKKWFLTEIDQSVDNIISLDQLYANYKIYCSIHRETAVIKSIFGKEFLSLANYFDIKPDKSRNKDGVFFRGVQFKPGIKLAPLVKIKKTK